MSAHTPGPWRYVRDSSDGVFAAHSHVWGPRVTIHCAGGDLDQAEPDMRLIAAAPELLEACQRAHEWLQGSEPHRAKYLGEVIAKATGATA